MHRITRLLRPAPNRTPSAAVTAALAIALPALALAGCVHAAQPVGESVKKPDKRAYVDFQSCAKPVWPRSSLAAKETGTVTLAFLVASYGSVGDSKVNKSSGHPALDEAARAGIHKCHFVPAQAAGQPVESWVRMQYVWTLK